MSCHRCLQLSATRKVTWSQATAEIDVTYDYCDFLVQPEGRTIENLKVAKNLPIFFVTEGNF